MANAQHPLVRHLELAVQAYGGDLPLFVKRLPRREAAVPSAAAAPARPAPSTPPAQPATRAPAPHRAAQAPPPPPPARPTPRETPAPAPRVPAAGGGIDTGAGSDLDTEARVQALAALRREVSECTRCKLHAGRQHTVFGEGSPTTRVLFVGEAPGATEDRTGRPFVGEAGQLLEKILQNAMGLRRSDVFIANVNKCRPPNNRTPEADEVAACVPFLRRQIEILRPEVIVCLGRTAAQNLLGTTASTTSLRGRSLEYMGIPVVVTWHPAYLLREPAHKRETWEDVKRVNRLLGLPEVPGAASVDAAPAPRAPDAAAGGNA